MPLSPAGVPSRAAIQAAIDEAASAVAANLPVWNNTVIATNASGLATIPFGKTFAAVPVVVAVGGNQEHITIAWPNVTTTNFQVLARTAAGAVIVGAIRVLWCAAPATP